MQNPELAENTKAVLAKTLKTTLKLLHPFMPFVTEEIWSNLNQKDLLMIAEWENGDMM